MSEVNLGVIAPVPKGEWDVDTVYEALNIVRLRGALYMAKSQSQGIEPLVATNWNSYWMLLFSQSTSVVPSLESIAIGQYVMLDTPQNPYDVYGGGEWLQLTERFLFAASDINNENPVYIGGDTGGSADAVVAGHRHTTLDFLGVSGWQNFSSSGAWLNFITGGSGNGIGLRLDKLKEDGYIGWGADQVLYEDGSYRYLYQTSSGGTRKEGKTDVDFSSEAFVDAKGKNMPLYQVAYFWKRIG